MTVMVSVASLGEQLAALRLSEPGAVEAMRRSLSSQGQLTPLVVVDAGASLETVDGFKRVRAARTLGWKELHAVPLDIGLVEAKLAFGVLHQRSGLTELEQAWIVRSLHRDDRLAQAEIARRMGRHKSWVCRRLLLVEALDAAVEAQVRLGLLAPRTAVSLAALPRGNQHAASTVVIQHGLTVRQTELFVGEILEQPTEAARAEWIAQRLERPIAESARRRPGRPRNEASSMMADIRTLLKVAARLEARLLGTPLGAFGPGAAEVILGGLIALRPALGALDRTLTTLTGQERAA
jgi:ParB-like chromosome segregation protein Spo0J